MAFGQSWCDGSLEHGGVLRYTKVNVFKGFYTSDSVGFLEWDSRGLRVQTMEASVVLAFDLLILCVYVSERPTEGGVFI